MNFRFLHAADIHLDSPLHGLDSADGAPVERIRNATRRALGNLVDLALAEDVAFVLIAGDLYDGDWQDNGIGLFFNRQAARLARADIPVYLIKGNHDRSRWIEESPFEGCHHLLELKNKPVKGASIVLCHYSMRVWNHSHRNGSWMLYGHDHGRLAPIKNSVDVGVDPNGFRPLALEEVARLIKKTQALVSYNEMPAEELEAQGMRP